MLRFYNTLSGQVEDFVSIEPGRVRMYICGPTVYGYAHIGNYRTFVFGDLLRRQLRRSGYDLRQVMNLTDVDDKTIRNAAQAGLSLRDYTGRYIQAFEEDCAALRLEKPELLVRATDHIADMIHAIDGLQQRGFTYQSDGSVYFRIAKFPAYGKLSKIDLAAILPGARVDQDEYEKADVRDFVLWKGAKPGEPFWDSEFGPGRPGWHIECSVMATKYLGETFDIHAGGTDLIFPHHENEIAQAEALSGKPFAHYWLHCEHLLVDGQKMSKSLGNFFTLRDLLEKGYTPESIRYLLLSVPHRRHLNFTMEGLRQAASSIERLENFRFRIANSEFPAGESSAIAERTAAFRQAFSAALDDDLNSAQALGALFELVREVNTAIDANDFKRGNVEAVLHCLREWDEIFDVLRPEGEAGLAAVAATQGINTAEVDRKVSQRQEARRKRDFALADQIRDELAAAGVILEDTKDGVRWRQK